MKQFSRDSLPVSTEVNARGKFEALADRFETLPLYFMKFHGGSDMDEVLDAMEYAVYVNDVEHIILVSHFFFKSSSLSYLVQLYHFVVVVVVVECLIFNEVITVNECTHKFFFVLFSLPFSLNMISYCRITCSL
jgi:hypothetical protein